MIHCWGWNIRPFESVNYPVLALYFMGSCRQQFAWRLLPQYVLDAIRCCELISGVGLTIAKL